MRRGITPLGAVTRGIIAGACGSAAQSLFFKATESVTPSSPPGVFEPPDPIQENESSPETVARRAIESFALRGEMSARAKQRGGHLVHYSFGATWGGTYALARESTPWMSTPLGIIAFSTGVWAFADNALLPAMRLAAPPTRYPPKVHAYALAAHWVYGASVAAVYGVLRPRSRALLKGAAFGALAWWRLRRLPAAARPSLRRTMRASARASKRWRAMGEGVSAAIR